MTVSIILPTYNRADTILRAVRSVVAQTFTDWTLHIVDDGSTDGTVSLVEGLDPRVRIHRQPNAGPAAARNRGVRESRGRYLAFLDSDDAWLPHHLELCMAFFDSNPGAHLVSGEVWIDRQGFFEKHFRVSMGEWYVDLARQIHSKSLDLPPGATDDYLRFYAHREELPKACQAILDRTPYRGAQLYRGDLSSKWRWGYLLATQSTVVTREAQERAGPFDESYRNTACFGWLARLCRQHPSYMISAPGCIEHWTSDRGPLIEERLLTGEGSALAFAEELLRWHEALYWNDAPADPELTAIRGLCQLYAGRVAARLGRRDEAARFLAGASNNLPGHTAQMLRWLVRLTPTAEATRIGYAAVARVEGLVSRAQGKLRSLISAAAARSDSSA